MSIVFFPFWFSNFRRSLFILYKIHRYASLAFSLRFTLTGTLPLGKCLRIDNIERRKKCTVNSSLLKRHATPPPQKKVSFECERNNKYILPTSSRSVSILILQPIYYFVYKKHELGNFETELRPKHSPVSCWQTAEHRADVECRYSARRLSNTILLSKILPRFHKKKTWSQISDWVFFSNIWSFFLSFEKTQISAFHKNIFVVIFNQFEKKT